jgi:stearoyl-CoA desaturase (delta-9 desaturase)
MTPRHKLLLIQIYAHILFLVGLVLLPATISIPTIIISQIVYVGVCGTAFFHRTVSHKNAINPIIEKILILLSWVGMSGSAMAWAGTHRKHHRYSDTEKDPHSPKHHGIIKTYWYSSGAGDIMRYVPDLLRQPWYLFQHKYYFKGLLVLHVLGILFLSFTYYWALLIVPAFLMWFSGSLINTCCHDDKGPINVSILGYFSAGEGWHKYHHEQPANSSFRHWADWGGHLHKLMSVK